MRSQTGPITTGRYLFVSLIFLIVSACSQGGDGSLEQPTPGITVETLTTQLSPTSTSVPPTLPPTLVPAALPQSPSPPSSTPEFDLPGLPLEAVQIGGCRTSGELGNRGLPGQGTAPAPTPTPLPPDGSRQPALIEKELLNLRGEVGPIIGALLDYNNAFQQNWVHADTAEEQAGQLFVFGNRLAQLCLAVSQLAVPPEIFSEVVGLSESIRVRHEWVAIAFGQLICCNNAQTAFLGVGLVSTSDAIGLATRKLGEILSEQLAVEEFESARIVVNDRFGFSLSIDNDAILVRNTVDLLVVFPDRSDILDPESLGPEPWYDGTAIRIRRLRNRSELTVEQAVLEYGSLLTRFGEADRRTDVDIHGLDAIQLSYPPFENDWVGSVLVFVSEDNTYFVEVMCQQDTNDLCESVRDVVGSLRLES